MSRSRALAACMALILATGCYSYPPTVQISPPQIVRRGQMDQLQFPGADPAVPQVAEIDVVIDTNGAPVMSTFKVTGSAAAANHDALYKYIQASTFRPGLQDGHPVSAVYHTRMQFKVQSP